MVGRPKMRRAAAAAAAAAALNLRRWRRGVERMCLACPVVAPAGSRWWSRSWRCRRSSWESRCALQVVDEAQIAEAHKCIWDPISSDDGHPPPDGKVTKLTTPLPGAPTIIFFRHRLVILVDVRLGADGNLGRHKNLYWFGPLGSVIPYVQFVLLMYLALVCSKGIQMSERGTRVPCL